MPVIKIDRPSLVENRHLVGHSKIVFYLVYTNGHESIKILKLFKKGFRHVYLVKFDGLFWQKLDFTLGFTDLRVLPYDSRDTIETVLEGQDVTYQRVSVWRKVRRYRVKSILAPYRSV